MPIWSCHQTTQSANWAATQSSQHVRHSEQKIHRCVWHTGKVSVGNILRKIWPSPLRDTADQLEGVAVIDTQFSSNGLGTGSLCSVRQWCKQRYLYLTQKYVEKMGHSLPALYTFPDTDSAGVTAQITLTVRWGVGCLSEICAVKSQNVDQKNWK